MSNRSRATKDARKLEKLYGTKARQIAHSTILRLIRERGLDGAIQQLEAWGLTPTMPQPDRIDGSIADEPTH